MNSNSSLRRCGHSSSSSGDKVGEVDDTSAYKITMPGAYQYDEIIHKGTKAIAVDIEHDHAERMKYTA